MTNAPKRVPIPRNGVDYRCKLVLAPMVRSGELPSRLLALHYGADLVWGPETVDRSMIGTTRTFNTALSTVDFTRLSNNGSHGPRKDQKESVIFRLHPEREGKKLIFQMGTSDPERAVEAAKLIAGDVAGIDVNAGCPKPFSTSGGMGAALLRTPDKLNQCQDSPAGDARGDRGAGAEALRDGDHGADDPLPDDADEAAGEGDTRAAEDDCGYMSGDGGGVLGERGCDVPGGCAGAGEFIWS
ncbi:hypothetical protein V497_05538 [Pseudogymnoascus sp. VKM F-4516 (FW-969)]|nr:hypothetical protein V497_05538 [Pseudogymnoascus sp. VKM F-4516 (FW-969)]